MSGNSVNGSGISFLVFGLLLAVFVGGLINISNTSITKNNVEYIKKKVDKPQLTLSVSESGDVDDSQFQLRVSVPSDDGNLVDRYFTCTPTPAK